ncbi:MAG: hypothetical protein WBG92_18610 [Thiohalocapsa sp.]
MAPRTALGVVANFPAIAWAVMTTGKTFDAARGALAKGAAATA